MPDLSIRLLINLFLVAGAGFALWRGGTAERSAAVIVIANAIIGEVGHRFGDDAETWIRLVNDGVAAIALLAVTVRFATPWMGGIMLFFAAQFAMHSFYLVTDRQHDYAYALINNINWSAITWCLIIGTVMSWRQRSRARKLAAQPAP